MEKKSLADKEPIIMGCALFTTAVVLDRFRAKDVLFYVDLIKNTFHADFISDEIQLQTIQVLRGLDKFEKKGWATKAEVRGKPVYQMTTFGLIELLKSFADTGKNMAVAEAIFVQSYLETYDQIIREYIGSLGDLTAQESNALDRVLSPDYVFKQQVEIA